jgi:leucine dehydrogenase
MGGGKSVLLRPAGEFDRAALFRTHGLAVESLGGRYLTAGDVGTSVEDLEQVATVTRHVGGRAGGIGDSGPFTAQGVLQAMRAVAEVALGRPDLRGVRVAVQGAGKVGADLCRRLLEAGAIVVVADRSPDRATAAAGGAGTVVGIDEIHRVEAEIFSPCALGGILHPAAVAELGARAVVGAANNQLATPEVMTLLAERGICYLPDFLANAGGILSGCADLLGYPPDDCVRRIDGIYDTSVAVLREAERQGELPVQAALRMARARIAAA